MNIDRHAYSNGRHRMRSWWTGEFPSDTIDTPQPRARALSRGDVLEDALGDLSLIEHSYLSRRHYLVYISPYFLPIYRRIDIFTTCTF